MSTARTIQQIFLAAFLTASLPAAAEDWTAMGDSITAGIGDTNPIPAGYPQRLQKLLRNSGLDVNVVNQGIPGETSGEALSRIGAVLASQPKRVLIQYGANDVPLIDLGLLSVETVINNIDQMARTAGARGAEPVLGTLLPRNTRFGPDPDNMISIDLVYRLRDRAVLTNRRLVDIWEGFDLANDPDSFDTLYAQIPRDPVGHPNSQGYDRIAELYRDVLVGLDTVKPVPGRFTPSFQTTTVPRAQLFVAILYEPQGAAGIDLDTASLLLNGRPVAGPDPDFSNRRRAAFVFKGAKTVGCRAELGIRASDRNDPPNVIDRTLRIFDVAGRSVLQGDVDFDCQVDGYDLIQVARRFGSRSGEALFSPRYDLDRDGRIDKKDLDRLEANFGKQSG